jgi:hypothetical protein
LSVRRTPCRSSAANVGLGLVGAVLGVQRAKVVGALVEHEHGVEQRRVG